MEQNNNETSSKEVSTRTMVTDKDMSDITGMTIRKGTKLFIEKEVNHPFKNLTTLFVRVDNGTGDTSLMPKTAINFKAI